MLRKVFIFIVMVLPVWTVCHKAYGLYNDKNEYMTANIENLLESAFYFQALELTDTQTFKEFLQAQHCELFQALGDNQFQWKRTHENFMSKQETFLQNQQSSYNKYRINLSVNVSGYNFSTHSFDIAEEFQVENVSLLEMLNYRGYAECPSKFDKFSDNLYQHIPTNYTVFLQKKLNLYRIPVDQQKARFLNQNIKDNTIYLDVFVSLKSVNKNIDDIQDEERKSLTFYGNVEKINFYTEATRIRPFKTLYYN